MKRLTVYLIILSIILIVIALPLAAQSTGVTAEAVGQANLRATPDVNAALVGAIQSGTRYPVIGRSEFYPWLLLGDPVSSASVVRRAHRARGVRTGRNRSAQRWHTDQRGDRLHRRGSHLQFDAEQAHPAPAAGRRLEGQDAAL